MERHVVIRFAARIGDARHVAKPDGHTVGRTDDKIAEGRHRARPAAGLDQCRRVGAHHTGAFEAHIRLDQRLLHAQRIKSARLKRGRIEFDRDLPRLSAEDGDFRGIGHLLEDIPQLGGQQTQLRGVVTGAPQRQRHHRHVVNRAKLHERRRTLGGQQTGGGREFLIQTDERALLVFAHEKPCDQHGATGARR